ncbi:lysE type translocator family protein [Burkholderia thailandensis MSMB121]|uniref:LysE family transporter n=3 Tax=Burkholderia humptydooensis TaxID=430531 RepID=A0A7U4P6S8_9BURK|nr:MULTISPECIES: LysE family transporter [Burkholderia]AGK47839.1 lysE type translocator family protein [Burkholderia thailandensis MSMB121]ATF35165.1 lysine transporter LysE [Burkholderia thailandensis]AJY42629.1 lysE type translocator family protein [Burkholderia sp. 2002721687]ALX44040.1 lysine transporter LysE [Burkholderia humptydooensis]KST75734.1 lysine transporter LysE [Burkholderia humptydooensis]
MNLLPILLQIAAVYLVALVTPGPNVFMISQLSLSGRRGLGAVSALGVGTASLTWATLAMLGLAAVLHQLAWLYEAIRIGGAIYLVYFGLKLLRASARREPALAADRPDDARAPLPPPAMRDYLRAYRTGLFTCLTNPKSCAFWTSVFAAMMPAHVPLWFNGATLLTIGAMSGGWYCSVAYLFANPRAQRGYRRVRRPLDALCGAALVGLGAKLAADR